MVEIYQEDLRLAALHQLRLLDTPSSESFDRIARMAAQIFGLPTAAMSLTDSKRQWFKSRVGVDHRSIPRHKAPCGQVAETRDFLVIRDFAEDAHYADSHLGRNGTRFYAGAPLVTREGFGLGALCVLGPDPRDVTEAEVTALTDLAAMVMAQIELQHAFGRVDPVSGLPNRNQFLEDLSDLANEPGGAEQTAALLDFHTAEQIGDYLRVMGPGHVDDLVRVAVLALRQVVGQDRLIYHLGPMQFALLAAPGVDQDDHIAEVEACRHAASARNAALGSCAVGIVSIGRRGMLPHDVLRAMHSAAQDARHLPELMGFYSRESDSIFRRRYHLLEDFGLALQAVGQLRLVYQPRIDLRSGACLGAEALLRWQHPEFGNIPPDDFIPMAERSIHAAALTNRVLGLALRQLRVWQDAGFAPNVSVNISAANLTEPGFVDSVAEALRRHDIPVGRLELEVTESAVMQNAAEALTRLQELSDMGIRLAIDDFGTGHSSLAYLQKLPVDVVKIDRSFVIDMDRSERDRTLVRSMIGLSHDLGYSVVAEGVETEATATLLRDMGCEEAQGYHFARPLEAEDFTNWLRAPQ